jgi:hypothetical protein
MAPGRGSRTSQFLPHASIAFPAMSHSHQSQDYTSTKDHGSHMDLFNGISADHLRFKEKVRLLPRLTFSYKPVLLCCVGLEPALLLHNPGWTSELASDLTSPSVTFSTPPFRYLTESLPLCLDLSLVHRLAWVASVLGVLQKKRPCTTCLSSDVCQWPVSSGHNLRSNEHGAVTVIFPTVTSVMSCNSDLKGMRRVHCPLLL